MTTPLATLARHLGDALKQKNLKVATAESCTGGGLGFWLTSIPGSSAWYERGFITYSNAAKMDMLRVKAKTLEQFGAVSAETAKEMAEGALKLSAADMTVAITGIAGPDGGSEEKPVGTVWIAYAGKNMPTTAVVDIFPGDRESIRHAVISRAIHSLTNLARG